MQIRIQDATPLQLDWLVAQAAGHPVFIGKDAVKAHLSGLDEDALWEALCENTPGAHDPSIMSNDEMIEYGASNWINPAYATDWNQGGPIIEREISNGMNLYGDGTTFGALYYDAVKQDSKFGSCFGPTPLIAAMRCFAMSRFGETVEVPDELCESLSQRERPSA